MSANKNVRANICLLRAMRDMTQGKLAEAVGVKRALVGSWEEGRSVPRLEQLILLADTFQLTVDDLIRDNIKEKLSKEK
jgi:DNA-binding XRE family transcriptional regulator